MHTHTQPFLPQIITAMVQTSTASALGSQTAAVTRAAAGITLQGDSRAPSPPDSHQAEMQQQADRCVCVLLGFPFSQALSRAWTHKTELSQEAQLPPRLIHSHITKAFLFHTTRGQLGLLWQFGPAWPPAQCQRPSCSHTPCTPPARAWPHLEMEAGSWSGISLNQQLQRCQEGGPLPARSCTRRRTDTGCTASSASWPRCSTCPRSGWWPAHATSCSC